MICDLRSDHSFDHLQVWTTWELWTLRHEKARISDKKAPKSTQNEAKDYCCFLWDVDAAGSNPVTPTKLVLYAQKISPFHKIRTDFFVYYLQLALVPKDHSF